jgi:hypothetical protein
MQHDIMNIEQGARNLEVLKVGTLHYSEFLAPCPIFESLLNIM